MTFSIAAHSGDAWGVAVASKFVCVGAIVPEVRVGVGAVASQAFCRHAYRAEILDALGSGVGVQAALDTAVAGDEGRESRQVGAVGPDGAATYTGSECMNWASGISWGDAREAYAIQGNILTSREVIEEMERAYLATVGEPLDRRLLAALLAGDDAGGDSRGRQSAAIIVHQPGTGYDGSGILADLRVDDHPNAPTELARVHASATLVLGSPEDVSPLVGALYEEVAGHLRTLGHSDPDLDSALASWAGIENLENRLVPGGIDARVLAELRRAVSGRSARGPMMEMTVDCPWGLLLITDVGATDELPTAWANDDEVFVRSEASIVVRVMHQDEGQVHVTVGPDAAAFDGVDVFEGTLQIASGALRVGDVLEHVKLDLPAAPGAHRLRLVLDDVHEARRVHIQVDG